MTAFIGRREFITLLGGAAAWPLTARAQQPRRIGVLLTGDATDAELQNRNKVFEAGLRDLGWIDGRNLKIDYRLAPADASSLRKQAAELVAARPELIVANTTSALAAAQQATGTIPIVFNFVTDPVAQGFIASLSRPGGNSTGFGHWQPTMGGKWLEILKETAPLVTHVAAVFNPDTATYSGLFLPTMEAAAHSLAVTLTVSPIHNTAGMERAVAAVAAQPNGGLMLLPDAFTWSIRSEIVALAARYRLPAIYQKCRCTTRRRGSLTVRRRSCDPGPRRRRGVDRTGPPADRVHQVRIVHGDISVGAVGVRRVCHARRR